MGCWEHYILYPFMDQESIVDRNGCNVLLWASTFEHWHWIMVSQHLETSFACCMVQPAQYVDVDARPRAHASHTGFALPLPSPPHNYHPQQRWWCQFCCMDRSILITCVGSGCSSTGFGDSSQYSWTQLCEVYTIYALRNCMISIILIR